MTQLGAKQTDTPLLFSYCRYLKNPLIVGGVLTLGFAAVIQYMRTSESEGYSGPQI